MLTIAGRLSPPLHEYKPNVVLFFFFFLFCFELFGVFICDKREGLIHSNNKFLVITAVDFELQ